MKHSLFIQPLFLVAALASTAVLSGCFLTSPSAQTSSTPTLAALPIQNPIVQATGTPTATVTPTPTASATISPTRQASATATPTLGAGMMRVKIFFIALGDNGKSGKPVGCGDSLVSVDRTIPQTVAPLTAALRELLSLHERTYGGSGHYNALYQSALKISQVSIVDFTAAIKLSGTLTLGDACDTARATAQIEETALQFVTVKRVTLWVNGASLPSAAGLMPVKIFLVAQGDNGKSGKLAGCGDSLVAVERLVARSNAPLTAALNELLSLADKFLGESGLYNALHRSSLKLSEVAIVGGKATIKLSGTFTSADPCDGDRAAAQIIETALQFVTVRQVAAFVSGIPLAQAFAGTSTEITARTSGATATPRVAASGAGTMRVKIFFIALGDNGRSGTAIGCGDSLVAVQRTVPRTNAPLTAALNELLSLHDRTYGESGLYNALYQSNLKLSDISLVGGKATINLAGALTLGDACDNTRAAAQIQATAFQFATVQQVAASVNGVSLDQGYIPITGPVLTPSAGTTPAATATNVPTPAPVNTTTNWVPPQPPSTDDTSVPTAANTPTTAPPTATRTRTPTSTPTRTNTPSGGATATLTNTPPPGTTSTYTPTSTSTGPTSTRTATGTRTNTPTNTPVPATNTPTITPTPTSTPGTTTFTAIADSYVKEDAASSNFGSETTLVAKGPPVWNSYIQFNVSGLGGTVQTAKLRVYSLTSNSTGFGVYGVSFNSWDEASITYANAPPSSSTMTGQSLGVTSGNWAEVTVTSLITGNGTFSMALKSPSAQIDLASSESAYPPQLVITTQ